LSGGVGQQGDLGGDPFDRGADKMTPFGSERQSRECCFGLRLPVGRGQAG
jgi:hypothetical protein